MKILIFIYLLIFIGNVCAYGKGVHNENMQKFRIRLSKFINNDKVKNHENEIIFGRGIASKLLGKYELLKDKKINDYVGKLGTGITAQFGRESVNYYFGILVSDKVNAFATSGGHIFITTGTLKIINNEAQLVGVLTHEISHDQRKHITKNLNLTDDKQDQSLSSAFNVLGNAVGTALERINLLAYKILTETGLPENDEFEADKDTIRILHKLGYNPYSYVKLLEKIKLNEENLQKGGLSKTHPATDLRIKKLNNLLISKEISIDEGKLNKDRYNNYVEL
tara:strand:- start:466 stop:1305 length:840 start_codon:yes stop_codon:yes gene_type:complete